MSLLRRTRTEMAGAWRSLRYDMGRAPAEPPAGGPDVTCTGMSTFGVVPPESEPAPRKRPRRALAVTAFGTLTVVGAAGAYLGVVNGLGSLISERPAAADTVATAAARAGVGPAAVPSPDAAGVRGVTPAPGTVVPPATSGLSGTGTGLGAGARLGTGAGGGLVAAAPPAPGAIPVPGRAANTANPISSARPVKPTKTECHCAPPPVPTPTGPTASPSPTPSESSGAEPTPSETSATPDESVEPSPSWRGRRHRRHNH